MLTRFILTAATAACALFGLSAAAQPVGEPIAPENILMLTTTKGDIVVVMEPDFAPGHVARIQGLAQREFYDGMLFHRVIDDFMAQGGSAELSGKPPSGLPNLTAEFTAEIPIGFDPVTFGVIRNRVLTVGDRSFTKIQERSITTDYGARDGDLSLYRGYVVFHEPSGMAALKGGVITTNIQHCTGVASMARQGAPDGAAAAAVTAAQNSANSQFFLMRAPSPWLDRNYSPWGRVVVGQSVVNALAVNDAADFPDVMLQVRLASQLPQSERPAVFRPLDDPAGAVTKALALAEGAAGDSFDACEMSPEWTVRMPGGGDGA